MLRSERLSDGRSRCAAAINSPTRYWAGTTTSVIVTLPSTICALALTKPRLKLPVNLQYAAKRGPGSGINLSCQQR